MTLGEALYSFNGRLSRFAYFTYSFVNIAFGILGFMVAYIFALANYPSFAALIGITTLGSCVYSGYALLVKRLHDIGVTGNYAWGFVISSAATTIFSTSAPVVSDFCLLVSFVGSLVVLFTPGYSGSNEYGTVPTY